ncbi:MAG TPA: hypothetical protein VFD82_08765 [Planctomycetota bacterium]|nr:hypothetical protein [Planctomycetota bacterium]
MSLIAIEPTCSNDSGKKVTPQGDAATCYALFSQELPATVTESQDLDQQNYYLYLAARDAGEDAQQDAGWPAGYSIETNTVVFSRQSSTGWDDTIPGCALALHDAGGTPLYYFGAQTV